MPPFRLFADTTRIGAGGWKGVLRLNPCERRRPAKELLFAQGAL
jgi:hypothetical protein